MIPAIMVGWSPFNPCRVAGWVYVSVPTYTPFARGSQHGAILHGGTHGHRRPLAPVSVPPDGSTPAPPPGRRLAPAGAVAPGHGARRARVAGAPAEGRTAPRRRAVSKRLVAGGQASGG